MPLCENRSSSPPKVEVNNYCNAATGRLSHSHRQCVQKCLAMWFLRYVNRETDGHAMTILRTRCMSEVKIATLAELFSGLLLLCIFCLILFVLNQVP